MPQDPSGLQPCIVLSGRFNQSFQSKPPPCAAAGAGADSPPLPPLLAEADPVQPPVKVTEEADPPHLLKTAADSIFRTTPTCGTRCSKAMRVQPSTTRGTASPIVMDGQVLIRLLRNQRGSVNTTESLYSDPQPWPEHSHL